jgi:addiction module RelE/StbE family toxin
MKVVWTEQARRRLSEIDAFIASDRPAAAARLIDKLVDRGDALASHPGCGRKLREIPGSGLRDLVVDPYRIVYRKTANSVEVLTVFEGHRLPRREEPPKTE